MKTYILIKLKTKQKQSLFKTSISPPPRRLSADLTSGSTILLLGYCVKPEASNSRILFWIYAHRLYLSPPLLSNH